MEETLRTLDGFAQAGKIRYYGLSNFTGWQLTKAVLTARALGLREPVTLQPQYSLIVREIEWEIVPAALDAGHGAAAVEPARRRLALRQVPARPAADRRHPARRGPRPGDGGLRPARQRPDLAGDRRGAAGRRRAAGVSMAEVALAWVNNRPAVASTILGARTTEQLETNLRAAGLELSAEEHAALDEASDLARQRLPVRRAGRRPASARRWTAASSGVIAVPGDAPSKPPASRPSRGAGSPGDVDP